MTHVFRRMKSRSGNLTKDIAPGLIHFPGDTTQQWMLMRMGKPQNKRQADPPQ